MVVNRITYLVPKRKKKTKSRIKSIERAVFLDTSAIIDGRIFDVIRLGLFLDVLAIPNEILLELKHIADSQDVVKRERGRKGLEMLEGLKKTKGIKVVVVPNENLLQKKEVDETLISIAKKYNGRIITCDYNLEKKAAIQGVKAININALANHLKITAVPGEALHIKIQHPGKDISQGVGYLDDGTMVVVESGVSDVDRTIDVVVSRVIQTASGRILFAKKI
ncbi:MAG: hypothetical protein HYV39_00375 [Candidatus Levybacteria bacterium]|nr:hypothetical protein [Candidatus Levybacteria bacterium]